MNADELADYVRSVEAGFSVGSGEGLELYWRFHPRYRFFKTLPFGAKLLDVGAEHGSLALWRGWGAPPREDIRLFGVDLGVGEHAGRYEAWNACDLDDQRPHFAHRFDAALMSHVLPQLRDPLGTLRWTAQALESGAQVYIEWGNPDASVMPLRNELAQRNVDVIMLNPREDSAIRTTFTVPQMAAAVQEAGLRVLDCGQVRMGAVADALVAEGRASGDVGAMTHGLWGRFGLSLYLTAEKP